MSEQKKKKKVLTLAQEKVSSASYQTFLKDTKLFKLQNEQAIVVTDDDFVANGLTQKLLKLLYMKQLVMR